MTGRRRRVRQGARARRDGTRAQARRAAAGAGVLQGAPPLARAYDWYSFNVLPRLGQWVAGDCNKYRYLAELIRMHPAQAELKAMMKATWFVHVDVHNLSAGVVAVHLGIRG